MMDDVNEYDALAKAIVTQAATDYYNALYTLKRDNKDMQSIKMKIDCELFFRGKWCKQLCDIDGEKIIKTIRERARKAR